MQLAETLLVRELAAAGSEPKMDAGGPGSGRHPGGGKYNTAVNTEHPFHQTMMQHGFQHVYSAKNSHYYKGAAARTPPSGKDRYGNPNTNAHWNVGHSIQLGTDRYKRTPTWHDTGDANRSGNTAESLGKHLQNVGWHDQGASPEKVNAGAAGKTKTIGTGEKLPASAFAYVGSKDDMSTWHLPIHDESHTRNALARVNQTQGVPAGAKAGVLNKIRQRAQHHGIAISEKTGKQKAWVRKGVKAGGPGSGPRPGYGDEEPNWVEDDEGTQKDVPEERVVTSPAEAREAFLRIVLKPRVAARRR
jgi:hypothetical protein